jgi:lysophospholipase L1-like esterase
VTHPISSESGTTPDSEQARAADSRRRGWRGAILALLALAGTALIAGPNNANDIVPGQCEVPADMLGSPYSLKRTETRLRQGEPLNIVAIGSSSTAGAGASSVAHSYPSQLEDELQRLFPRSTITVLNRGISGQNVTDMIKRLNTDAIEHKPDLVIWQTGTNSALAHADVNAFAADLESGVTAVQDAKIDLMLMGPQYAPRVEAVAERREYIARIIEIANTHRVPFFPRYEVMRHWLDSGQFQMSSMINTDGLHMTDDSYACLGQLAARMISNLSIGTATSAR